MALNVGLCEGCLRDYTQLVMYVKKPSGIKLYCYYCALDVLEGREPCSAPKKEQVIVEKNDCTNLPRAKAFETAQQQVKRMVLAYATL